MVYMHLGTIRKIGQLSIIFLLIFYFFQNNQLRNYNIDDSLAAYDFGNDNSDLLQRATRMDFDNYLSGDILVKVDRASMANSLEVRAPLLDKNLVEFAFKKVPSNLKANSINKKIILFYISHRCVYFNLAGLKFFYYYWKISKKVATK